MSEFSFGPFKIPDDPKRLLNLLEQRNDALIKERAPFDHKAKVNLAFYEGYQWLVPVGGTSATPSLRRVIHDPDDPHSRLQLSINKFGSQVDRLVARVTKGSPVPECRPVSLEEDDLSVARVGTRILASEAERIRLQDLILRLYYWVVTCGTGFLHTTWDGEDGDRVGIDDEENDLYLGNVLVTPVPQFEIVMDPSAHNIRQARWCIRTVALTAEEIYERWGKDIEASETPRVRTVSEEVSGLGQLFRRYNASEKFAVRQFWLRPNSNRSRPNGMVVTWVGDQILKEPEDFPYSHARLPFAQFNFIPSNYGPWGSTPATDLVEMQQDYNHARSREADIRDRLFPKLLATLGSVDPDLVGPMVEAILFRPIGPEPRMTDVPTNWMQMFEITMNRGDSEMGERTGINEALRGELAGTSPGVSILAQQEAASEPLSTPAKEMAAGLADQGWQHLMLVREFWEEKRTVRTWSESGTLEVSRFSKGDIARELDVHVSIESALPRSKAGRLALLSELADRGFANDPRLWTKVLDLPPTDIISQMFDIDVRHAERENDTMTKARLTARKVPIQQPDGSILTDEGGQEVTQDVPDITNVPPVEEWHNHQIHISVHNDFRKTAEFENYGRAVRMAFDGHVQAHMAVLAQMMQQQQGPQGPESNGGPPMNGGPPSGPDFNQAVADNASIGGRPGQPGRIPGVPMDIEAGAIGE